MTLSQLADQVTGTVRLGDALGKSNQQIHEEVHAILGHLPLSQVEAVHRLIADEAASTWR